MTVPNAARASTEVEELPNNIVDIDSDEYVGNRGGQSREVLTQVSSSPLAFISFCCASTALSIQRSRPPRCRPLKYWTLGLLGILGFDQWVVPLSMQPHVQLAEIPGLTSLGALLTATRAFKFREPKGCTQPLKLRAEGAQNHHGNGLVAASC